MGRQAWVALMLACAACAGAAAQNGSATDTKMVTVTGCVQNFSTRSSSGSTERGFILSKTDGTGAPTATGTSGTAAGHPSAMTDNSYRLIGSDDELKEHVGKRVEVTGKVEPPDVDEAKGASSTAAAPGTIPATAPRLEVASIRAVGSDCTAR
jgi:hypothetical protein